MSVTTTATTSTQGVIRLLADYELTHSGDEPNNTGANEQPQYDLPENPGWWPIDHNGVPRYRPIDYGLDREQRPWGSSPVEVAFVWTMLNGVGLVACASKVWRHTGGRINDKIFRFSVGGER